MQNFRHVDKLFFFYNCIWINKLINIVWYFYKKNIPLKKQFYWNHRFFFLQETIFSLEMLILNNKRNTILSISDCGNEKKIKILSQMSLGRWILEGKFEFVYI